ncbi:MAG: AMP-binding protein [Actinomycetes bacterium]
MGETEKRELLTISPEWSIPQLQEKIADAITGEGPALATGNIQNKLVAEDIALVVETSGSTGEPKSVAISTSALIASTNAAHKYLGATPGDSWSLLLPTSHIAGLNVLARATALGTKVIDNRNVSSYVDADFVSIVPTQLHRAVNGDAKLLEHLTAAEAVLVGGGVISDGLRKSATDKHVKVVTTYGMTEMCGGCVYNQKLLDGVEIQISSEGLIKLRGPMMASNYLNDQAGWSELTSDGWFQTSDLGEFVDGKLRILGRADDVIKSGGEKISLIDIEERFRRFFPGIEVVAFGVPDAEWGEKLCLGVISNLSLTEVQAKLTGINSPKEIIVLQQIPRTILGKVDRKALTKLAIGS